MSTAPRRLAVVLLSALAGPLILGAADWPQWRGPHRTGETGEPLPASLPEEIPVAWRIPAGEGFASPVVAGNRVFLFDNQGGRETLRALSARDGSEAWRADVDATFRDSQGPPGPRCTPVVDGERVYVQSCRGELRCLSTADGRPLWSASYSGDFGVVFVGEKGNAPGATRHGNNGAPLVDGPWLYALVGSTNGAGVVCFDKLTGKVRWQSANEVAAYAPPVLSSPGPDRQLVTFLADAALGLDPDSGSVRWRFPIQTAFARHVMTPVLFGGSHPVTVIGSHQAGLIGLATGPGAAEGVRQLWVSKEAAPNFSSGFGLGRHFFGLGPRKDLVCVDVDSGAVLWSRADWTSSPADRAHAGFLWSAAPDPRALSLLDDGQLILWEPDTAGYRELGRSQVCRGNWCSPAYAGGRLFLRDGLKGTGELRCLVLAGK